ncbi:MAG: toll/interleukin-1 receptor domain-containing protein, partial [Chloroflexota bacterium]
MTDVFVSYSRRDKPFVEKLVTALVQDGRDVWIDWEDIPRAADWLNEIDKGIENATTFVFVVSTHSLTSEICNHELAYALKFNKRVVPLIREDITGDTDTMVKGTWVGKSWSDQATANWTAVGHLNWIFFNNDDEEKFKTEFQALLETLDADLDHIKTHTRIQVREREWEENQRNPSYLLGGEEISEAEAWLQAADSGNKNPPPTNMHRTYIEKSRSAEDDRLRNLRRLESRTRQFRTA